MDLVLEPARHPTCCSRTSREPPGARSDPSTRSAVGEGAHPAAARTQPLTTTRQHPLVDVLAGRERREEGAGDLGRALLVREQPGTGNDLEGGIGERVDHRCSPLDGEERIVLPPDESHGFVDAGVEGGEISHVLLVEAVEELHGGSTPCWLSADRLEE